jgi:Zn-dependent M28 family amino/carboxypeptidase
MWRLTQSDLWTITMLVALAFRAIRMIGLSIALVAAQPSGIAGAESIVGNSSVVGLRDGAAGEGAFLHLRALQDIASRNGGNRAAGTAGYDRSAEYVAEKLKEAGYAVRFEEFDFPFFEERAPPILVLSTPDGQQVSATAVRTLTNSGAGAVIARLRAVRLGLDTGLPRASTSGCEAGDLNGFERGSVALMRRGTCTFQTKVENAVAAGAIGVIIMNEGTDGRVDTYSGQLSKPATVPVVGVSYEFGRSLENAAGGGADVRLAVDAVTGTRTTRNVVADTGRDGDGPLTVVGAHLDSVAEGPGINDNGSGSAAVLETALQLPGQARQGLRFAFWGAEERGLIGSRHHVGALSEEQRRRVALYINLDMVGSPNFARFVQSSVASGELAEIARRELLADFRQHNLPVTERSGGRYGTDDASFSEKGIPTVGLYTGADWPKSDTDAGLFGGTASRPYDPCYHRACDTIENINRDVLEQNTRALVRAVNTVATAARRVGTSSEPLAPAESKP